MRWWFMQRQSCVVHFTTTSLHVCCSQLDTTGRKLLEVRKFLQEELNGICGCGLTAEHITSGEFQCLSNANKVTYRARLSGTPEASASVIISLAEEWIALGEANSVNIDGQTLSVDSTCQQVQISSYDDPVCSTTEPKSSNEGGDNSTVIFSAVAAFALLIGILTVVVITVVVVRHWRSRKAHAQRQSGYVNIIASAIAFFL